MVLMKNTMANSLRLQELARVARVEVSMVVLLNGSVVLRNNPNFRISIP